MALVVRRPLLVERRNDLRRRAQIVLDHDGAIVVVFLPIRVIRDIAVTVPLNTLVVQPVFLEGGALVRGELIEDLEVAIRGRVVEQEGAGPALAAVDTNAGRDGLRDTDIPVGHLRLGRPLRQQGPGQATHYPEAGRDQRRREWRDQPEGGAARDLQLRPRPGPAGSPSPFGQILQAKVACGVDVSWSPVLAFKPSGSGSPGPVRGARLR